MKYISNMVASFEKKLAIILMFAMAVIVAAAVVFRYVFNEPLFWAGEVSVFLLIYITFIGGSLGLKYKTQASMTLITDYLPAKVNKWVAIMAHIFMLLVHGHSIILLFFMDYFTNRRNPKIERNIAAYGDSICDSAGWPAIRVDPSTQQYA